VSEVQPHSSLCRRLNQIRRLGARDSGDLARAAFELFAARRRLGQMTAAKLRAEQNEQGQSPTPSEAAVAARVAWAIPRAAAIVPWRSDCLVQADAARRWLRRSGISSEIRLGARRGPAGAIEAHAWLLLGETVVTGGDISGFEPFE